jgi:hypothetical protein
VEAQRWRLRRRWPKDSEPSSAITVSIVSSEVRSPAVGLRPDWWLIFRYQAKDCASKKSSGINAGAVAG